MRNKEEAFFNSLSAVIREIVKPQVVNTGSHHNLINDVRYNPVNDEKSTESNYTRENRMGVGRFGGKF